MKNDSNNLKTKEFMTLLIPNQSRIHAFILYLVPNHNDADDILQETFTEMWNKFNDYTAGTNFVAWAITIAKYKILNYRKKKYKQFIGLKNETIEILQKEGIKSLDTVDEQIDTLKKCIEKLTVREKKYLRLRYENSLTFKRIADQFGISIQAVCKTISRIHTRLIRCVRLNLRFEEIP
jgi:RNA polymerase sigma-70 factor (ECF subfamily)